MLIMMFVTFYTSRVILSVLGVSDYGLYNVISGITSVVTFFSGSLSNVTQRYLNIALGINDDKACNKYFCQFLMIFVVISVVVLIIGSLFMPVVIDHLLTIPENRIYAAKWVYWSALISLLFVLLQIPYQSAIVAHEKMSSFAYLSLVDVLARLGILYVIESFSNNDRLIWYAILQGMVAVFVFISYYLYCNIKFKECKYNYYFDKSLLREVASFVGYNVYGCFAFSVSQQGVNVLLNVFFGPVVNAARAISLQVYNGVFRFTENIYTAVKPPIIKLYAQSSIERMLSLANKSTKFCMLINVLLTLPVVMNISFILRIWLKEVPQCTIEFIYIVLIESYFNIVNQMTSILVNASGNLKRNQFYGRTFTLLVLPIAYLLLLYHKEPFVPMLVAMIGNILYMVNNLFDIKKQFGLKLTDFVKSVLFPPISLFTVVGILIWMYVTVYGEGWVTLLASVVITLVVGITFSYLALLDRDEKTFLNEKVRSLICRL
jgi:O-antigen/teichoic acid export membrane protein